MNAKELAEQNTILRVLVGSRLHGLAMDGQDDRDEMGICIEPKEYVVGLRNFEQWTYRSQPEGVRSGPGDLDVTVYSLRKWARLALNGNPTVLALLFAPQECLLFETRWGVLLRNKAPLFLSKRAGRAFLGYLTAQKERLTGDRGQKRTRREDLVCRFGYDVKYAMHAYRLGIQGIELLETGRITLPMPEPWRGMAREIRQGTVLLPVVTGAINEFERRLQDLLTTSPLPDEPDRAAVDTFLCLAYASWWAYKEDAA